MAALSRRGGRPLLLGQARETTNLGGGEREEMGYIQRWRTKENQEEEKC